MECLSQLIAIKSTCDTPVTHSGYYLDDIDITIKEVEKLIGEDQISPADFVSNKTNFAAKQIAETINGKFKGKYLAATLLSGGRVGWEQDNKTTVASNNKRKGIRLEVCNTNTYTRMYVSRLSLFTSHTGNVDVKIYDLTQGKLLDTITVACVADEISYANVNKTYTSLSKKLNLAFLYGSTGITSYETFLTAGSCYDCQGGYGMANVNNYVKAYAVTSALADDEIPDNLDAMSETGGLAVHFNLSCDHENWLCDRGNVLALPILYLTAAEIMRYGVMVSSRSNTKTLYRLEDMKSRMDFYELKYRESLDNILPQIKPPSDGLCFTCNDRIITKVMTI